MALSHVRLGWPCWLPRMAPVRAFFVFLGRNIFTVAHEDAADPGHGMPLRRSACAVGVFCWPACKREWGRLVMNVLTLSSRAGIRSLFLFAALAIPATQIGCVTTASAFVEA